MTLSYDYSSVLKSLPAELQRKFREHENVSKKIINAERSIVSNNLCLKENILPDYLQDKNIGEILNVMGEATVTELKKANRPVRVIYVDDDTINSAIHLMTMLLLEVALIGEIIGINPFNQPAVERIKDTTKFILDNYDRN